MHLPILSAIQSCLVGIINNCSYDDSRIATKSSSYVIIHKIACQYIYTENYEVKTRK